MNDFRDVLVSDILEFREICDVERRCSADRFLDFVKRHKECCQRSLAVGHCTGSALLTDPHGSQVLLLFHPKLQRWVQPGGHADGDPDLLSVAWREAEEETGLQAESLVPFSSERSGATRPLPFDLDIHEIPERGSEAAHLHYDLRFLFLADPSQALVGETPDLKLEWVAVEKVIERTSEESVLRMVRRLATLPRDDSGKLTRS